MGWGGQCGCIGLGIRGSRGRRRSEEERSVGLLANIYIYIYIYI